MTVAEKLMNVGRWEVTLKPDTPRAVLDELDLRRSGFGHIVITSTRVNPNAISDADMLALSRYTGIYRKQPDEFSLAGAGVNAWLGDEDGKGRSYGGLAPSGSFASWVSALTPSFLKPGTTSTIAGTFAKTFARGVFRTPLDEVCKFFGAEWVVGNDFRFSVGLPADLFRATPIAVVVRNEADGGRDPNVLGLVGDMGLERDVEDWARTVYYYTGTEASPTTSSANGGIADNDVPFRGPDGTFAWVDKVITDFGTTPTVSGPGLAAAEFTKNRNARQEITLSTRAYDISQDVRVGDNLWVYDPQRGIADINNDLLYRGQIIHPEIIRCVGYTWPIRVGSGVYFRRYVKEGGTWVVRWIDLTNYVDFEDGETRVEVGAKPRTN